MGCTIYAASHKALPADEAPGQDRYYQLPRYGHLHGNCSQRIAATRARSVSSASETTTARHRAATLTRHKAQKQRISI